mmetsp:Transcript_38920/g.62377  ORF Transcript_38920/g.62377 Transcript_38920/m.62377 type:complete len:546 (+) Transcript_38920:17-1654(+)
MTLNSKHKKWCDAKLTEAKSGDLLKIQKKYFEEGFKRVNESMVDLRRKFRERNKDWNEDKLMKACNEKGLKHKKGNPAKTFDASTYKWFMQKFAELELKLSKKRPAAESQVLTESTKKKKKLKTVAKLKPASNPKPKAESNAKPHAPPLGKNDLWSLAKQLGVTKSEDLTVIEARFGIQPKSTSKSKRIDKIKAAVKGMKWKKPVLVELCKSNSVKGHSGKNIEALLDLIFEAALKATKKSTPKTKQPSKPKPSPEAKGQKKPKPKPKPKPKSVKKKEKAEIDSSAASIGLGLVGAFPSKSKSPSEIIGKKTTFKSRLLDVMDESHISSPLTGIRKVKIISLKESIKECCRKITQLSFSELKPAVLSAMDFAHNLKMEDPDEKLNEDEIAAIHLYTQETPFYGTLNKLLRNKDRKVAKPLFQYLHILTDALAKLKNKKGVVYRGVARDLSKAHKNGRIVTWWAISSTTKEPGITNQFLGDESQQKTFFYITTHRAKDIKKYSAVPGEAELIIGMGTSFEVKSVIPMGPTARNVFMTERKGPPKWS